jgi:thioredoxin 1
MQVTLIVLFAHWCSKCNMMMPVVDEIEVYKEQLEVVRIDIEKETEIAKDYSIQIVPTFVIMKQGNEVMRMAGIIGEEILKKRIETVIEK